MNAFISTEDLNSLKKDLEALMLLFKKPTQLTFFSNGNLNQEVLPILTNLTNAKTCLENLETLYNNINYLNQIAHTQGGSSNTQDGSFQVSFAYNMDGNSNYLVNYLYLSLASYKNICDIFLANITQAKEVANEPTIKSKLQELHDSFLSKLPAVEVELSIIPTPSYSNEDYKSKGLTC